MGCNTSKSPDGGWPEGRGDGGGSGGKSRGGFAEGGDDRGSVPGGQGYRIGPEIARGGMSVVHHCTKKGDKTPYACKVINKKKLLYGYGVSSKQREKEERHLHNEIRALRALDHPNIIKVHHCHESDAKIYIVMEMCDAGELFDFIIESKALSEADASAIARQIANAVAYSHEKGYVHRDLKPDNLLLKNIPPSKPDDIKIADFGFAMSTSAPTKSILGTPGYVAPEIRRKEAYDAKVDVWSLGVIYYVMLIGYLPYDAETEVIPGHTTWAEIEQKFKLDIDSKEWQHISVSAKDLLWRMLQPNPANRITAAEVRDHPWVRGETARKDVAVQAAAKLKSERTAMLSKADLTLHDELYLGCCGPVAGGSKKGGRLQGGHRPSAVQTTPWDSDQTGNAAAPTSKVSVSSAGRASGMRKGSDLNLGAATMDSGMNRLAAARSQQLAIPSASMRFGFVSQRGFNVDDMMQPNRDCMGVCLPPLPGLSVGERAGPAGACADHAMWVVCDGHGEWGHRCSRFVREFLPAALGRQLQLTLGELEKQEAEGQLDLSGTAGANAEAEAVAAAFEAAFAETNTALGKEKRVDDNWSGTSVVAALLLHGVLHVANTGDCRAVLAVDYGSKKKAAAAAAASAAGAGGSGRARKAKSGILAMDLTVDHTPLRPDERGRVAALGARVLTLAQLTAKETEDAGRAADDAAAALAAEQSGDAIKWCEGDPPRVWVPFGQFPGTAFTRSVGDRAATDAVGLIATPEVTSFPLANSAKGGGRPAFLVLGTDGLFAFLTSQAVVDIAASFEDPLEACKAAVSESYAMWLQYETRTDHITCVTVRLDEVSPRKEVLATNSSDPKRGSLGNSDRKQGSEPDLTSPRPRGRASGGWLSGAMGGANPLNPARMGGGGEGEDEAAAMSPGGKRNSQRYSRRGSANAAAGATGAAAGSSGDAAPDEQVGGSQRVSARRRSSRKMKDEMEDWQEQLAAEEAAGKFDDEAAAAGEGGDSFGGGAIPGGAKLDNSGKPLRGPKARRRSTASGQRPKTDAELARINAAVRANFMFKHLNEEQRFAIFRAMTRITVPNGFVVPGVEQGDPVSNDSCFFVVDTGTFEVRVRRKGFKPPLGSSEDPEANYGPVVHSYDAGVGGHFGELALMRDAPRAATVIATGVGRTEGGQSVNALWCLRRSAFQEILMKSPMQHIVSILRKVSVLSALRTQELQRLAEVLTEVHFEAGDDIIDQGAAGDTFYVLVSGAAVCTIADGSGGQVEVMRLAPFDYFGERALLSGEPRAASVRVLHAAEGGDAEGARCLHIGRAAFEEVLGSLRDIIDADRKEREVAAAASIRIGGGSGGGGGGKKGNKKGKAGGAVRMDDVQMTLGGGRR